MKALLLLLASIWTVNVFAQEPISDNSFLIEEAYNQEPRVVQHISNLVYSRPSKDWNYSLTQEWPVFVMKHQFSYTIPYTWLHSNSEKGFGDIFLNYRYQLMADDASYWIAPRVSLILPTGNDKKGLGGGKAAYQVNLPVSRKFNEQWAVHVNAGATLTPGVNTGLKKETLLDYNLGASAIFFVKWNLNLMLEYSTTFEDNGSGHDATHIINPGIRYAYNAGGLQIVPGLAFPIQLNGSHKAKRIFIYLSFEHPF